MVKIKIKQRDIHWISSFFTKNEKYDMVMFGGFYMVTAQPGSSTSEKKCPKLSNDNDVAFFKSTMLAIWPLSY